MTTPRRAMSGVLTHPVAVAALATLVANDHVLKARYPGLVTGKLSDFAGMVVAPLVLLVATSAVAPTRLAERRSFGAIAPWACALVVAAAFAATKTWEPATRLYEVAMAAARAPLRRVLAQALGRGPWGETIELVRDPTDLVALPMGALAAWIGRPPKG